MLATLLGVLIAAAPPRVPVTAASCPAQTIRVVEESKFAYPPSARPTNGRVRFLVDLGSDGRIRRTVMVESSGDAALDSAAGQAMNQFRFAPPSMRCVAASSVASWWWDMSAATIEPSPTAVPSPVPAASAPVCAEPFARPNRMRLPANREVPGTARIDVFLDAAARVTGVMLASSSGNKRTDYAATVAARNATYVFERQPGCAPSATKYRLELTFR